nr:hypothetical protein [Kaistia soli]
MPIAASLADEGAEADVHRMQAGGRDQKTSSIGKTGGVFRHFSAMSEAVEDGKRSDDSHRDCDRKNLTLKATAGRDR